MQNKHTGINGASRRRSGDRDLGSRSEQSRNDQQNHRQLRPGTGPNTSTESSGRSGHQPVGQTSSTQPGISKGSGDKMEVDAGAEIGDGGKETLNHHLVYLTACLIGQFVEVLLKSGSIYSGVFHTANAEKGYGIVLKVARLVRDGSSRGKLEAAKDLARRPVNTLIISAKDLVQITAKDVPVTKEVLQNGRTRENRAEILTDSFLSQGRHGEGERELQPWTPDINDNSDADLDSTFQNSWNRNWDQFEANKNLFGVESTFDEDLYTTKLEKGPQMRERERDAWRIACEMEGQSTQNLHLAEDRGRIDKLDLLDEERRFSSVLRQSQDNVEEYEDTNHDIHNHEIFLEFFPNTNTPIAAATGSKHGLNATNLQEGESRKLDRPILVISDEDPGAFLVDTCAPNYDDSSNTAGRDTSAHAVMVGGLTGAVPVGDTTSIQALNLDPGCPQISEHVYREFVEFRQQENSKRGKKHREDQVNELKSFSESLKDLTVKQQTGATAGGTRKTTAVHPLPSVLSVASTVSSSSSTAPEPDAGTRIVLQSRSSSSGSSEELMRVMSNEADSVEIPSLTGNQSSLETPITSLKSIASVATPSSSSSSSGVSITFDSFKKSKFNPSAKEFKLNPNAKSFTPSFTPLGAPSPTSLNPSYVPAAQLQGMPAVVSVNPFLQPVGQSATTKYASYSPVTVAVGSSTNPYAPSPGTYTPGASGAAVSPVLGGGQSTIKVAPQLQQSLVGQSYGSQHPIRYTSQAPSGQPTSTYLQHPNGHLYSQQMVYGQPGQVVYIQPYPQGPSMSPPQPGQAASQQTQPRHRGASVQLCVAPPFIAGQQHFLPQVQVPQLSNPLQPTPGVLTPTTMSAIQPPQGVIGGIVTSVQPNLGASSGTGVMRVGGKFVNVNFQQ